MSRAHGFAAETKAKKYLIKQGLKEITCNYQTRCGEIDLIMRDGNFLVFIEVRARASKAFGDAVASITRTKRQKLIKTAQRYLLEHRIYEHRPVRFDVIGLDGSDQTIRWVKNAFGLDY